MENILPKFEVGQKVKDKITGKVKIISYLQYCDSDDNCQWYYSFDSLNWYLYPEDDLEEI